MNSCKNLSDHIKRLQGQLSGLDKRINEASSCDKIVHLALSASKSFDSLKAKIVEGLLKEKYIKNSDKDLQTLLKLIK